MMHMTFYWSKTVTLLFDFWRTDSWLSYAISLLACLMFSVFYQDLEDRRLQFKLQSLNKTESPQANDGINTTVASATTATPLMSGRKFGKLTGVRISGAILFGVNAAIGYLLMLSVMSFNGGVLVAIVLGLSLGYLIFRSGEQEEVVLDVESSCACA